MLVGAFAGCGARKDSHDVAAATRMTGLPSFGLVAQTSRGSVVRSLSGHVYARLPRKAVLDMGPADFTGVLTPPGIQKLWIEGGALKIEPAHHAWLSGGAEIVGTNPGSWRIERDGKVLWQPKVRSFFMRSVHHDIVSTQGLAYDVRTGTTRRLPASCRVTDRQGADWYLVCYERDAIRLLTADGRMKLIARAPRLSLRQLGDRGSWNWAELSPDGSTLLAQGSLECETPEAYFIPARGGSPTLATGDRKLAQAPESLARGWLPDGRALVHLPKGACGNGSSPPGLYSVVPGGHPRLVQRGEVDFWRSSD